VRAAHLRGLQDIEADGAGLGALGQQAMPTASLASAGTSFLSSFGCLLLEEGGLPRLPHDDRRRTCRRRCVGRLKQARLAMTSAVSISTVKRHEAQPRRLAGNAATLAALRRALGEGEGLNLFRKTAAGQVCGSNPQ
jgi:hypothetical protein